MTPAPDPTPTDTSGRLCPHCGKQVYTRTHRNRCVSGRIGIARRHRETMAALDRIEDKYGLSGIPAAPAPSDPTP